VGRSLSCREGKEQTEEGKREKKDGKRENSTLGPPHEAIEIANKGLSQKNTKNGGREGEKRKGKWKRIAKRSERKKD